MTHPDVGYSQAEDLMVAAEGAVETRVLRRQGDTARWSGLDSNSRATLYTVSKGLESVKEFKSDCYGVARKRLIRATAAMWSSPLSGFALCRHATGCCEGGPRSHLHRLR